MSMISEQVNRLRGYAEACRTVSDHITAKYLDGAADTIEELSAKLHNSQMDWITEEMPEKEGSYLVTWKGKFWVDSYMGFCEWDGTRWLMEDFEPYKKYTGIIITAWSDIEPYKDR